MVLSKVVKDEAQGCWKYFFDNYSRSELSFGLMIDQFPKDNYKCSIAGTGFFLASLVAGVELGFAEKATVEPIASKTIDTIEKLPNEEGFFYHFYDMRNNQRLYQCEVSTIDTALLLAGVITVGEYFGGQVKSKAYRLLDRVNWRYFVEENSKLFHMAKYDNGFHAYWDVSSEQLLLYVLSGSGKNKVDKECYYAFKRLYGRYEQYEFIHGWFGSIFTHQFSHAFVDFFRLKDQNGVNWYKNSVTATLANRQYCIDSKNLHKGYGQNSWGLTACATKDGYQGRIGAPPSGNDNMEHISDGTVAPAGAIGSIVFCPTLAISAIEHYATIPRLKGKYGFFDSFNADIDWVSCEYISIDKGISLLAIANYYNNCITSYFGASARIKEALDYIGFIEDEEV